MNRASLAAAVMMFAVGIAQAQAPQALLQEYKCYVCHADNETKTGPAFADVAEHQDWAERAEGEAYVGNRCLRYFASQAAEGWGGIRLHQPACLQRRRRLLK